MQVKSLHIYPIKGAGAVDLLTSDLGARGLAYDRRWMLVDASGKFLTQREYPKTATIKAALTAQGLRVRAEGLGAIDIQEPVDFSADKSTPVKIWKDACAAFAADPSANAWFTALIGVPCTLVFQGNQHRAVDATWGQPGDETSFADGFPLLVANTASLRDLSERVGAQVLMERFRPNIVIETDIPWVEDEWKTLKIGAVEIDIVKPCTRCVVTTTDQKTGQRDGQEPLRTLTKFRLVAAPGLTGAIFGQNAVPRSHGTIAVGDTVTVGKTQLPPAFRLPKTS